MTQDQYGQAQDSGYVRGQVVDDDADEFQDEQGKPMTRFQKVASALRGDRPDRDDPDQVDQDQVDSSAPQAPGPNGMTPEAHDDPPYPASGAQRGDYWDNPDSGTAGQNQATEVTNPDIPVTDGVGTDASLNADRDAVTDQDAGYAQRTQPDAFAAGTSSGNGTTVADGNGAATVADAPITQTPQDAAVTDAPDNTDAPDSTAGRHAAVPAQGEQELHPGEATGTLDDLGDLAYGNLIPDAAQFTDQWKEIQFKFVDDPRASVTEAAEVVSQVTAKMAAAMQERQRAIEARQKAIADQQSSLRGRWGDDAEADTETLRETLRMYRAFLDQLIGPKA